MRSARQRRPLEDDLTLIEKTRGSLEDRLASGWMYFSGELGSGAADEMNYDTFDVYFSITLEMYNATYR